MDRFSRRVGWALLVGVALQAAATAADKVPIQPAEPLPEKPRHTHFIDETQRTPQGHPNAGARWCDSFLRAALAGRLKQTAAQTTWDQWGMFLDCAIWGYLSPDSAHHGDERLLDMSRKWLDELFVRLQTKPTDPKLAAKWQPDTLGSWSFHHYTMPLLEVAARPKLKEQLGIERIDRFRAIVLKNIARQTTPEAFDDRMGRAENYINIITHPMAVYVHGWVLTGDRRLLQMAQRIVHTLGRDQLPNGMFPYRRGLYGEQHCEYETMYYHAINVRALYLYWWATGSREAADILRRSIPYYPLNLEPPHHFNDGADIWWKDQWRTFWPHHIAMVAAVTGDGENAAIANEMARRNVSHDRFDVTLGAHVYQQMALRGVTEKPVRDRYVMADPDIRGARLRFGRWSSTFTCGSFTYTRASAMKVSDDGATFTALHMARPYVRVAPLERASRTEPDYGTLPAQGAQPTLVIGGRMAVAATSYRPALTAATWRDHQPLAPWQMNELWLMTGRGLLGLIDSRCTETMRARELCHMFRFIPPGREGGGQQFSPSLFQCGKLRLRVWDTDLPRVVVERTRRYALSPKDRRDWQVCLTDVARSPEQVAQAPADAGETRSLLRLPGEREYAAGARYASLVEVSPTDVEAFVEVKRVSRGDVIALQARVDGRRLLVLFNADRVATPYRFEKAPARVASSWKPAPEPTLTLTVPSRGAALVMW